MVVVPPKSFTWSAGTTADWSVGADWAPRPLSAPGTVAAKKEVVTFAGTTTGNKDPYTVGIGPGETFDVATINVAAAKDQHSAPSLAITGSLFTDTLAYGASVKAVPIAINEGGLFDIRTAIANAGAVDETITVAGGGAGGHLELGSAGQGGGIVYDPSVTLAFANSVTGRNAGLIEYMSGFTVGMTVNQKVSGLAWGDAISFDGANFTGDTFAYAGATLTVKSGGTTVVTMTNLAGPGLTGNSFHAAGNAIVVAPGFVWGSAGSGTWTTPSGWSGNRGVGYPGSAGHDATDTAPISATGDNYTVTYNLASDTIGALTMNSANATLALSTAGTALTVTGDTALGAGTINVATATAALATGSLSQTGGSFTESAGNVSVAGLASLAGGATDTISGGTFSAGTLSVAADLSFQGGTVASGVGGITIGAGRTVTIKAPADLNATLGGLIDDGTILGSGAIDGAIAGTGVLKASGGTLDLKGAVAGPALSIDTKTGSDLKIDGKAISALPITLGDASQRLEIGATGALTINGAELVAGGSIALDNAGSSLGVGSLALSSGSINGLNNGTLVAGTGAVVRSGVNITAGGSIDVSGGTLLTTFFTQSAGAFTQSGGLVTLSGTANFAGGIASVSGGLFAAGVLQDSGGTLVVTGGIGSGGTLQSYTGTTLASGSITANTGTLIAGNGATAGAGTVITTGGSLTVTGGTLATSALTQSAGTLTQSGGVIAVAGLANLAGGRADTIAGGAFNAGALTVGALNGSAQTLSLAGGATTVSGMTTIENAATPGGSAIAMSGGSLAANGGLTFATGNGAGPGSLRGFGSVSGGAVAGAGTILAAGGVLSLSNDLASGAVLLEVDSAASSALALAGIISTAIGFTYLNTGGVFGGTLLLANSIAVTSFGTDGVISGMHVATGLGAAAADLLDLRPIGSADIGSTDIVGGTLIEVWNAGHTATLAGFHLVGAVAGGTFVDWQSDGAGGTEFFLSTVVCYVAGTRILTATGERTVESLRPGDLVLTLADGDLIAQPVKWIGRRRLDLARHPRPATVAPVRIRRGAIAEAVPHRDLLVSPDHAVFIDGRLICARQLVNGATIRQETGWAAVDYCHVELDAHAILLAEGLPAESYLDTGNHGFFANAGAPLVLHPDLTADEADLPTRAAGSCAPFVADAASVLPVWQRLADRAAALGEPAHPPATTADPALRIVARGRTVRPLYGENGLFIFALPKGATEVRLVSRAGAPSDARPWLDDRRRLGVSVERIVLRGAGELHEVPVDHPGLSRGWQAVERDGAALRRWTSGDALLRLPPLRGPGMLEIRAGTGGMAYPAGDLRGGDAGEDTTRRAA